MENKLYFLPANYGKGKKKHATEKTGAVSCSKNKNHKALKFGGILLFLLVAALIIVWLMRGKTTTTGQFPANVRTESLSCESTDLYYPKISVKDSAGKDLKINLVFDENGSLKSISLIYALKFRSSEEVKSAEAKSHAEFNLGLNALGYNSEEFNNKFASYDDSLIISLFGSQADLDEYKSPYFMISGAETKDDIPSTIEEFKDIYEVEGFVCTLTKK